MRPIRRTVILGLSMLLMACGGSTEKIENDMNEPNSYEKKNIGSVLALYPSPLTVIGATVDGKVNWTLVAHVGVMGHDRVMVSMKKDHHSNVGIRQNRMLSINMVDEAMLSKADLMGCVSGADVDKSGTFKYTLHNEVPTIDESPLTMVCEVVDNYQTETFDNFICRIVGTYVAEEALNEQGKIDYNTLKPVLFEFPTYKYLRTGDVIGDCKKMHK